MLYNKFTPPPPFFYIYSYSLNTHLTETKMDAIPNLPVLLNGFCSPSKTETTAHGRR